MICIYPPDCTDFSTNGAGTLTPSSCTVTETLNGGYEVTLEHPIDEAGKWTRLSVGCILRVPVPEAMTPYVKLPDQRIKLDKTSRGVWRITQTAQVRIQAGFNYKIIKALTGENSLDISIVNTMMPKYREKMELAQQRMEEAKAKMEEEKEESKEARREIKELASWAEVFDDSQPDVRKMIIARLVERIDVGADYSVKIRLKINMRQYTGEVA